MTTKDRTVSLDRNPEAAAFRPAGPPRTLGREHELLLAQVSVRAGDVLMATAVGRWPSGELRALVGYLRTEVLRQAEDEEWLLFPAAHAAPGFAGLGRDHVRLRASVEALERAASGRGAQSPAEVAALTRELVVQLEQHLAAEEAALAEADAPAEVPATTSAVTHQHGWYPLTEGPVIDLDRLPPEEMADAAVDRLRRLRHGEQVELRASRDIGVVWQRMDQLQPGRYGFDYLQDGPGEWRVQVTRRH